MPKVEVIEHSGFNLHKLIPETPLEGTPPVLIGPGFGSSATAYHLLMEEIAARGFTALCPDYEYDWERDPKMLFLFPDVDQVKQKVNTAIINEEGFPNEQGIPQVIGLTHSKGSIEFVSIARVHPEYFTDLILDAASGIHNWGRAHAIARLRWGDFKDTRDKKRLIAQGGEVANLLLASREGSHDYNYKRKWLHCYTEIFTGATHTIHQDLQTLRDFGIRVVMVAHEDDSMFPLSNYERLIGDKVDEFVVMRGTHGSIKYDRGICRDLAGLIKQ